MIEVVSYKKIFLNPISVGSKYIILSYFLFLSTVANSQNPSLRQFNKEDGLPGIHIYNTIQDRNGYIWAATDRGVTKFNGKEFTNYTIKDGLPFNEVWILSEDDSGRIWFSTFSQLCYFENGKIHTWKNNLGLDLSTKIVTHNITDHYHYLRIGGKSYEITGDSILSLKPIDDNNHLLFQFGASTINYELSNNNNTNKASTGTEQSQKKTYAIDNSIIKFDNPGFEIELANKASDIKGCASIDTATVLVIKKGKLFIIDKEGINPLTLNDNKINQENQFFRRVLKLKDNMIWIQTENSNLIYDRQWQRISSYAFLEEMNINYLMVDDQDNLWISTIDGMFFLSAKSLNSKIFGIRNKINIANLNFLTLVDDKVWALNKSGILYMYTKDQGLLQMSKNSIISEPKTIEHDKFGNLWIAGDMLIKIEKQTLDRISKSPNIDDKDLIKHKITSVKDIYISSTHIYYSSYDSIRYRLTNSTDQFKGIIPKRYYTLKQTKDNEIWSSGVNSTILSDLSGNNITSNEFKKTFLFNSSAVGIEELSSGATYFALNNKGVYLYNDNRLDSIAEITGMNIQSTYLGEQDDLWVCTNEGLLKILTINESPFEYKLEKYTQTDGLASNDVWEVIVKNDMIYATTDKGFSVISLKNPINNNPIKTIKYSSIRINGADTTLLSQYKLNHDQNSIVLNFECKDYSNIDNIIYEYHMGGINDTWVTTKESHKEYSFLSPGTYKFKVRRKAEFTAEAFESQSIEFIIKQTFWQRPSSILSALFLSGILGFLYYNSRLKSFKKKTEEKNLLLRKFADLELKALQSQMNPHFIFNAMNAIQDFVIKKDERSANKYIVKFSTLMRAFLESSKEKYIFLNDEIDLLSNYIDLEKLRFEDTFDYQINIDESVDLYSIEIPTMLLQPFVENAINHGLMHRKTIGFLTINFFVKDRILNCHIIDNGIGRQEAQKIKEQSLFSYKSRSMQIVEERQKVLNDLEENQINFTLIDLEEDGIPCGTKVELSINI